MPRIIYCEPQQQQYWRAIAEFDYGESSLIMFGPSFSYIKHRYISAFQQLFTQEIRNHCSKISVEQWIGKPDKGHWEEHTELSPTAKLDKLIDDEVR